MRSPGSQKSSPSLQLRGGGCGASKQGRTEEVSFPSAAKHKPANDPVLKHFCPFDDPLAEAIKGGAIRLLDAAALRAGALPELARRQDLEERERAGGPALLLPPAAAAAALRAADRRVCFLTHAWKTCAHPDPDGATLAALTRFLRHPLGAHIVGVFVDFACLHQPPRTKEQEEAFRSALCVMPRSPIYVCICIYVI